MRSLGTLYAAAVTPLTEDDRLDLDGVGPLLAHLARSGCDGVVVGGTTGEGLALSAKERAALMAEALQARPAGLRVIAGTGSSALPNVIALTRRAFELGAEGVLIMPPLHVRSPSVMGLLGWYRRIIAESVPPGGRVLLYHIPQVSGVPIANEVVRGLQAAFPDRLLGMKDSQGDRAHTLDWCRRFRDLAVFVGHDTLLSAALGVGAAGAILASANVFAPWARALLDAHGRGEDTSAFQARLDAARALLDTLSAPAALKALLAERDGLPAPGRPWPVRLPLVSLNRAAREQLRAAADALTAADAAA